MNFEQKRLIMNAFITSHFSTCSVAWVFHSRKLIIVLTHLKKESCGLFGETKKQSSRGFINFINKEETLAQVLS